MRLPRQAHSRLRHEALLAAARAEAAAEAAEAKARGDLAGPQAAAVEAAGPVAGESDGGSPPSGGGGGGGGSLLFGDLGMGLGEDRDTPNQTADRCGSTLSLVVLCVVVCGLVVAGGERRWVPENSPHLPFLPRAWLGT